MIVLFTLATARGRRALIDPEPWIAAAAGRHRGVSARRMAQERARSRHLRFQRQRRGRRQLSPGRAGSVLALVATHLGLALMVGFASGWPRQRRERAPEIDRNPVEPFARRFRLFFRAGAGGLRDCDCVSPAAGLGRSTASRRWWCCPAWRWWSPPATRIMLYRERLVSSAWLGLLVVPPALVVLGTFCAAVDGGGRSQDRAAGQCRGAIFWREFPAPHRQAARLRDRRCAACAAGRARRAKPAACLFRLGAAAQPVGQCRRCRAQGGMLVWPAADNAGTPPATLKAQFPAMVPEVPRSFARSIQGLLPLDQGRLVGDPPAKPVIFSDNSRLRAPCRGTASR